MHTNQNLIDIAISYQIAKLNSIKPTISLTTSIQMVTQNLSLMQLLINGMETMCPMEKMGLSVKILKSFFTIAVGIAQTIPFNS